MKNYYQQALMGLSAIFLIGSCAQIHTRPMHESLYPSNNEDVTYTIETNSNKDIKEIILYERVDTVFPNTISLGNEIELRTWTPPAGQQLVNRSFTKVGGYASNTLVNYRFEVKSGCTTREHQVSYAIRPYPRGRQAAPVYVQGSPDDVLDIVFIPDSAITDPSLFRTRCRNMIVNTIHTERFLKKYN